jgi:Ribbon-helix-helix protein, copG family.
MTSRKIQITLSGIALERLDKLSKEKGLSRAVIISLALELYEKEESKKQ